MDYEVRVLRRNETLRFSEDYPVWSEALDRARSIANDDGYDVRIYSSGVLVAQWIDGVRVSPA